MLQKPHELLIENSKYGNTNNLLKLIFNTNISNEKSISLWNTVLVCLTIWWSIPEKEKAS